MEGVRFIGLPVQRRRGVVDHEGTSVVMKPIGPLMIEHRLIEKMIALIDSRIGGFEERNERRRRRVGWADEFTLMRTNA